jgi:hypothetical protein
MITTEQIRREFEAKEISYIDAVLTLQNLGWQSEDAEDTVEEWEQHHMDIDGKRVTGPVAQK